MTDQDAERDQLAAMLNETELQQLALGAWLRDRAPRLLAYVLASGASTWLAVEVSGWLHRLWREGASDLFLAVVCVQLAMTAGLLWSVSKLVTYYALLVRKYTRMRRFIQRHRRGGLIRWR